MPELPEVELVKRELAPVINLTITDVELSDHIYNGHKNNKRTIVKDDLEALQKLYSLAAKKVADANGFKNLVSIMEAIIAFHKANGGDDK